MWLQRDKGIWMRRSMTPQLHSKLANIMWLCMQVPKACHMYWAKKTRKQGHAIAHMYVINAWSYNELCLFPFYICSLEFQLFLITPVMDYQKSKLKITLAIMSIFRSTKSSNPCSSSHFDNDMLVWLIGEHVVVFNL